jgi:glycosyltransferase involved in cell wall biosynthesis
VGDGNLYNQLAYWSRYLGIQDVVILHGRVTLDQVRDILDEADIYLQPSISESLCIATIEGMAMELPIVATTVGEFPEMVDEGESGFLVPPGDADAIATALKKLINQPEMAKSMGKLGRKIVLEKYTLDAERQNWLQVYRSLTDES